MKLNKAMCLVVIAMMVLVEDQQAQSSTNKTTGDEIIPAQLIPDDTALPWTLVPAYSWSFFNKGRDSWQQESLDLYYYFDKQQLLLGASMDAMHRPPNGDDIVYGLNAAWYALEDIELHGSIALTQDADFLPSERYSLGMKYRLNPNQELLFDVEQMYFGAYAPGWEDGITQVKAGARYKFTDKSFATARYTHGWVHNQARYDYYSGAVTLGDLPRDGQLTLGLAYGTDPDLDFGTNSTALSDAYTISLFYREPIKPSLTAFAGIEYVYRMRADSSSELYQMWTPTIGLSWKF